MSEALAVNIGLVILFVIGYLGIIIEHEIRVSKAATALLMAISCWILLFLHQGIPREEQLRFLGVHIALISEVVFFLLGALTIVEIINAHNGFQLISQWIHVSSKRGTLWLIGIITFLLSAILDNLTTTIVMLAIVRKLVSDQQERWIVGSAVVVAANAGGAWSPIGDVTTTMLWIGGQISTFKIMSSLMLPSLACLCIALIWFSCLLKGKLAKRSDHKTTALQPRGKTIFALGVLCLILVPIFKMMTGLPPFLGMLFGLSVLWLITDIIHSTYQERQFLRVPAVLTKVDLSSTLFFFGILLAISALDVGGLLKDLAQWLSLRVPSEELITLSIGLISSVIDNVPLVAAAIGMYDLSSYAQDAAFWEMLTYTAGTGGSILIIGSAAGIALMAIEKVTFWWYLKYVSLPALFSYLIGFGVYQLQRI